MVLMSLLLCVACNIGGLLVTKALLVLQLVRVPAELVRGNTLRCNLVITYTTSTS